MTTCVPVNYQITVTEFVATPLTRPFLINVLIAGVCALAHLSSGGDNIIGGAPDVMANQVHYHLMCTFP